MKRYVYSAAALSWIDPAAKLPEYDGANGPDDPLTAAGVIQTKNCRFAHLLVCQITLNDSGNIVGHSIVSPSGLHTRLSAFDTAPQRYAVRTDISKFNSQSATFVQTVGCRTQAPEVVGGRAGEEIGGAVGAGINPGLMSPGRKVGRVLGKLLTEKVLVFPPIWTTLAITITSDGLCYGQVTAHSLFPSVSFYLTDRQTMSRQDQSVSFLWNKIGGYDGVPNLDSWQQQGWGKGNPWRVNHP